MYDAFIKIFLIKKYIKNIFLIFFSIFNIIMSELQKHYLKNH